jgi:hypothetical protein
MAAAGCATVAALIEEICANEDEAEWLVREMIENLDRWPGPAQMRKIHRDKYHPPPELRDDQPRYKRQTGLCEQCAGWGCKQDPSGRWVECDCGFWAHTPRHEVEAVLRMQNSRYGKAWVGFFSKPADPHAKREGRKNA